MLCVMDTDTPTTIPDPDGEIFAKIKRLASVIREETAITLYHELAARFGWVGTFFTRDDAETEWQAQTRFDENGDEMNTAPMPDEVWENIQNEWYWRRGLSDTLTERGWELVYEAVNSAIAAMDDRDGECDCGAKYHVGSRTDHNGDTGECWDCSEWSRSTVTDDEYEKYLAGIPREEW